MSYLPKQNPQRSLFDADKMRAFTQGVKNFYQRIHNFNPARNQQIYLRGLSWTSLILALAIFTLGIWVGSSFDNLQRQFEQNQQIQQTTNNEFFTLLANLQNNLQNLQTKIEDNQANATTVEEFQILLNQVIQSHRADISQIQTLLDLIVQKQAAAYVVNTSQTVALKTAIFNVQYLLIAMLVAVIVLIVALAINSALIAWSDFRTRRELQGLRDEWLEKGIKTGILKTTETLDLDPSVLRNIMSWMYDYGHNRRDVDAAFDLFTQLIVRFSFLNFHPVGQIGEKVIFNPNKHRNTEANIHPGDTGYIYETGWMLDNEVIRKPLVIRRGI
jgi:hypothetical protein